MNLFVKRFKDLSIEELYEILKVRVEVFVVEQNCPYQEVDDKDKQSYHIYLKDHTGIKAYLRVIDKGVAYEETSIGRVLTIDRGRGLGNQILSEGIKVAKEKMNADKIKIEAQSYAREFYEKFGFKQISDEFIEDGIPHVEMILNLS